MTTTWVLSGVTELHITAGAQINGICEALLHIAEIYTNVAEDAGMSLSAKRTLQGPGGLIHGDSELLSQMSPI
ncbi:hypothetical protein [Rhizobium rhizogenes]|uniref:hypothetical protein n=1 Tax=Rhizobium rhizogenes TaxID=359 RepID=UPI001F45ED5A|nr:hypothetical protein [Rhizobium rhizogenes]